jgi:hypothetical protein
LSGRRNEFLIFLYMNGAAITYKERCECPENARSVSPKSPVSMPIRTDLGM